MSQGHRSPSFVHEYRSKFYKNFANYGTYYCDGCLLRNFSGPLSNCQSCNDFCVCQKYISNINQFHDPSHNFELKVSNTQLKLENTGVTCHRCSTNNFTGVRYNCQQCLDPFEGEGEGGWAIFIPSMNYTDQKKCLSRRRSECTLNSCSTFPASKLLSTSREPKETINLFENSSQCESTHNGTSTACSSSEKLISSPVRYRKDPVLLPFAPPTIFCWSTIGLVSETLNYVQK